VYRRSLVSVRVVLALVLGGIVLVPEASLAAPLQESDPAASSNSNEAALVDVTVDVERADETDLAAAFGDVRENVELQMTALDQAEQRVVAAEFVLAGAEAKVAETQAQIDMLTAQADVVVIEAFMSPASETAIDSMTTRDAAEASVKQALLDIQADSDAEVLADLEAAEDELQRRREEEEDAADTAERARDDAQASLDDLLAAASQEVNFATDIEARINRNLAEAAALEEIDPELAQQIRDQSAGLAMQITASRTALEQDEILSAAGVAPGGGSDGPSVIQPVSGGVVAVTCPSGGSIEVAGEIARDVQGLLNRASEQGVSVCGNGFRDPSDQVALRRRNCGSSQYAIYEAPSSYCSPPTAPPGSSMLELGLAIDFTYGGGGAIGCGGEAYDFLDDNAADFGLYNLPGECWHWSTDGT
jgi:hypothetical protein